MTIDIATYPKTELFWMKDTYATPHPYMITNKHVEYASDHGGILDKNNIDNSKIRCGVPGCELSIHEHEPILIVSVPSDCESYQNKLQQYLLSIKEKAISEGVVGFAFMKRK